ncbi:MAG: hypothetical protein H6715_01200 [Myxococcales bacterium]|nr:hypothetical protein [Myxococcales bacterium]MCB9708912.1 hypothetical protein [Myxococcales bacterium]
MSRDLLFLIAFTAVGAAWLATHLAILLWTILGARTPWLGKCLALIPFMTPLVYWRYRGHIFPVLWGIFMTTYVALRVAY